MVKIHRIKKNASTTLALLEPMLISSANIDIVVLRDPIERFWSACKSLHPDIMFHDKVITVHHGEISKSNVAEVNLESAIAACISMAQETQVEPHFMKQSDVIGSKKFDYVFKFNEIDTKLQELIRTNVISVNLTNKFISALEFVSIDNYKKMNVSPKDRDAAAMSIINANHLTLLNALYATDISLYNDPSSLLK